MKTHWQSLTITLLLLTALHARGDAVARQDRMHLADGLFRRGLFDLAAREYRSLAGGSDTNGMDNILFRLGECERRLNHGADAEKAYQQLLTTTPTSYFAPRARLQLALLEMKKGGSSALDSAATTLQTLTAPNMPPEVRPAAMYHLGEVLEKLDRAAEALTNYVALAEQFTGTDYGVYAGLRSAWLLNRAGTVEDRRRALGIYLELSYKATDPKVVEEALFFASQLSLTDKRYEESARLYETLRRKFPHSPRVARGALTAAWANYYAGLYKEGADILDQVLDDKSHPEREEILYAKANCLRQLKHRGEAATFYARQLDEFPRGRLAEQAWYEWLTTVFRDGQQAEVLRVAGLRLPPPDKDADNVYWMCAEAAMALDKPEEAEQYCRLLVEKRPQSPFVKDALYRLGWLLQKQEVWESASSWFMQLVERFPKDPLASKALYASGVCRARLGQGEAALRDWTTLLTKYPSCEEAPEALYQKAMEELRAKNPRAAGATLDERMRRFPEDGRKAEILFWRACVLHQTGELAEAEKMFRATLAAHPPKEFEREAMLELGILLQQLKRETEAADIFQKLLDAPITERIGVDRLAWLVEFHYDQKQLDAATKAARALLALQPDKGWVQTACALLGRVHLAKGERDAAMASFREALTSQANTEYGAEAALSLGELLTDAGKFDEAAHMLNDAATRADTPEMLTLRMRSYAALARNAEASGDSAAALRYHMSVGILFDDPTLVPTSLHKSAILLEKMGRGEEANKMRKELKSRFPNSPLAAPPQTGALGRPPEREVA